MKQNNRNTNESLGIVEIIPEALEGYPLVSITEENLRIVSSYRFASLTYERPKGDSRIGSAEIQLFDSYGDIEVEKLEFSFRFSENERLQHASQSSSFKLRKEALLRQDPKSIKPIDIIPLYSDVIIQSSRYSLTPMFDHPELEMQSVELDEKKRRRKKVKRKHLVDKYPEYGFIVIQFYFVNESSWRKLKTTEIPVPKNLTLEQTQQILGKDFNKEIVEKFQDKEVIKGLVKSANEITRFQINNEFLNEGPPINVPVDVLIPGVGVSFRKIDYIPPIAITDTLAYFQVEYEFEGRVYNEKVKFHFHKSIQDVALDKIKSIPLSDFVYVPKNRITPPTYIKAKDFKYEGNLPGIRVEQVNYNYDMIKMDDRIIKVELIVSYRLVNLAIFKRLEFRYSKAEYISGDYRQAKTENGSIDIDEMFYEPKNLYKAYMDVDGMKKELLRTATIVKGYPYESIKSIDVINFDDDSQYGMFKIVAIENYGERKYERVFEKRIELKESLNEQKLDDLTEKDIKVQPEHIPLFASESIPERAFEIVYPMFRIFSIKYNVPKDTEKSALIHLQIGTDLKTKTVKKRVEFTYSKQEFQNILWEQDIKKYLRSIDPSTITVKVDLNAKPTPIITKDMIEGVPVGIDYAVEYKPPRPGTTHTRMKLRMWKGNVKIAFEQTLIFAEPSDKY